MKLKDSNNISNWNILVFCDQWKMMSDLNMSMEKIWFCFIFIAWVHFSHKTEKFQFWKSLKLCMIYICMMSDLNMSCGSRFVVWLEFGNMLENTDFKLYWNSLIFFSYQIFCQIKICPFFCLICTFWLYDKKFQIKK